MKTRLLITTAAFVLMGGMAFAVTVDEVVKEYQDKGYTNIEVKQGPTQIKVEASNGPNTDKVEVIIDAETGNVITSEVNRGEGGDVRRGVEVNDSRRDFSNDDDRDDDRDDDDSDDDDDDSDDDDDDHGDDHGGDDHGGDDNGGDRDDD